ncbi:hypothetical protein [Candidatus Thiodiazotropha sp. CDECU1]|uniref:hypothetical protein n=1 Tax=Candidatus Thiodiazotropha sp. CDECU1 TaxID=3065865 RepID=UPI00292FB393|nr:hypothetical protein [Candidatus Thiodiazotropha sp. CDECU1]
MNRETSQQAISAANVDKPVRNTLDFPFWITHVALVTGWILMPSLTSVIMFSIAVIATISYVINIGKFAKETGRNPTLWSMLTLLGVFIIGPFAMWISYIRSFDKVVESTES